jgi:serine/threonine protein phosphatase PrpC
MPVMPEMGTLTNSNRSSPSSFLDRLTDDGHDDIFECDFDESSHSLEDLDNRQIAVKFGEHSFMISKFKTENKNNACPRLRWRSGSCSEFGPREKNEDRFVAIEDICSNNNLHTTSNPARVDSNGESYQGFFAVYDGHGGIHAANYAHSDLHVNIFKHPLFSTDIQTAVAEACVDTDRIFLSRCQELKQFSGTTALGAIIRNDLLTVFNIGDCQAVLGRRDGEARSMSNSHKPGREDETERIIRAGGWVTEERELYLGRLHQMDLQDPAIRERAQEVTWVTIHRVCGELSVSRSIGDPDYKGFVPGAKADDSFFLWPQGHDQIFQADLVIPKPEFQSKTLTEDDEFLIIASDGLWYMRTYQ